jgi:hypothetical protein
MIVLRVNTGVVMKKMSLAAAGFIALMAIGCDSNGPGGKPEPFAFYHPTSGQNLAPGIAPYAHGDPNWPMDAGQSGGGGGKR